MKKFIKCLVLFFVAAFVLDWSFGMVCKYLNSHAKGGDTKSHYYVAKQCKEEVLIFGSSRALHHYVPSLMTDSLHTTVYNCGWGGNGIVLMYARLLMVTQRYTPKLIIYDLHDGFDFEEDDLIKYIGNQKRFFDIPGVSDVIEMVSPMEKYKLISNFYRYNGTFVQMLTDNIHPMSDLSDGGYQPLYGEMRYTPEAKAKEKIHTWNAVKKECMIRFVSLCREKGIRLVFVVSPYSTGQEFPCKDLITSFASEYKVPLYYYYESPEFVGKTEYFEDTSHMNDKGARKFTSIIVQELKVFLRQKDSLL